MHFSIYTKNVKRNFKRLLFKRFEQGLRFGNVLMNAILLFKPHHGS